jgi:hypothetical protein
VLEPEDPGEPGVAPPPQRSSTGHPSVSSKSSMPTVLPPPPPVPVAVLKQEDPNPTAQGTPKAG